MVGLRLLFVAMIGVVASSCGLITTDDADSTVPDDHSVVGKQCDYGVEVVPSVALSAGPITVHYDLQTRRPSISIGVTPISFGILRLDVGTTSDTSPPGCYTVTLIDSAEEITYFIAIDSPDDELYLLGAGEFWQMSRQRGLTMEISGLCELVVFSSSQQVPSVSDECPGVGPSFWVIQLGAFKSASNAERHVRDLEADGLRSLQIQTTESWASICPGSVLVWSRSFSTKAAALDCSASLPDDVVADRFPRLVSDAVSARPANC